MHRAPRSEHKQKLVSIQSSEYTYHLTENTSLPRDRLAAVPQVLAAIGHGSSGDDLDNAATLSLGSSAVFSSPIAMISRRRSEHAVCANVNYRPRTCLGPAGTQRKDDKIRTLWLLLVRLQKPPSHGHIVSELRLSSSY